jgi:hypothetical protein
MSSLVIGLIFFTPLRQAYAWESPLMILWLYYHDWVARASSARTGPVTFR